MAARAASRRVWRCCRWRYWRSFSPHQPLIIKRHETVGPHNALAAQKKAFTALSTKTPTTVFSQNARQNIESQNLTSFSELLLLGGGFPVLYQNEVVGAIGIAGSGGSKNDDWCAEQAIKMTFK